MTHPSDSPEGLSGQVIPLFGESTDPPRERTDPRDAARRPPPAQLVAPVPDPLKDRRQRRAAAILRNLRGQLDGMLTRGANLETGFPAARVDLGALQEMLEQSLAGLDMPGLRARWEVDVRRFLEETLEAHVQRLKDLELQCGEQAVHIRFRTQDDLGWYSYGFDLVPDRSER